MFKSYALHEIESVEQVAILANETIIVSSNVSPGSWSIANPTFVPILDALEARAPLGWERVQLDGICRYQLLLTNRTVQQIRDQRARLAGWRDSAQMDAELGMA